MRASASIERALEGDGLPVRHGVFVAVVGPSGAGKDTLIAEVRRRLGHARSDIAFVRRLVTRPADAAIEDHDTLDESAFEAARAAGRFALSWRANGLGYALPATTDDVVRSGRVAVANVSRGAVAALRERYANVVVIVVTAPREVLAERLAARGRETRGEVLARLARGADAALEIDSATVIDNSNSLAEGADRFLAALRKAAAWAAVADAT